MCTHPICILNPKTQSYQVVPCGLCMDCRLDYTSATAVRIMHEKLFHKHSCFLTLTYDPEFLPKDLNLKKQHVRQFYDELRKKIGYSKIKYFDCGEYGNPESDPTLYGDYTGRPHYHCIIFGWCPNDLVFYKHSKDGDLFTSDFLKSIWRRGFSTVGDVTYNSARYVASYVVKKHKGNDKDWYTIHSKVPEYSKRSKGIGKSYALKFKDQIKHDGFIRCGKRKYPVFRYYEDLIFNEQEKEERSKIKNEYFEKFQRAFKERMSGTAYRDFVKGWTPRRSGYVPSVKDFAGWKDLERRQEQEQRLKNLVERKRKK